MDATERSKGRFVPGSSVSVAFVDFWDGFDPYAYLVPLLKASPFNFDVQIVHRSEANIEIHSVFQPRSKRIRARVLRGSRRIILGRTAASSDRALRRGSGPVRIWLTGENVRPPLGAWDATLSFDPDSDVSRNAYFPLWWQMFPELIGGNVVARPGIVKISKTLPLDVFLTRREGEVDGRSKFACAIISNPEPTRMRAIEALQQIAPVEVFGRAVGRPVKDKFEIFRQYQFALCFENDAYPGYVTEKLFDAWGAGCIPIWWGLDKGSHLNQSAFLNLAECAGLDALVAEVARLRQDRDALEIMSCLPLLLRRPSLDGVRALLARVLLDPSEQS